MSGADQPNRRYRKILIIVALSLCAWQQLYAVIVLETPQTEVKVLVVDRVAERNALAPTSLLLPLCSIVITAKHHGKGYLEITYTPLNNEIEEVSYRLFCDNLEMIIPGSFSYCSNPYIPLTVPLTMLSVKLSHPLQSVHISYHSEVFFHLKLEA